MKDYWKGVIAPLVLVLAWVLALGIPDRPEEVFALLCWAVVGAVILVTVLDGLRWLVSLHSAFQPPRRTDYYGVPPEHPACRSTLVPTAEGLGRVLSGDTGLQSALQRENDENRARRREMHRKMVRTVDSRGQRRYRLGGRFVSRATARELIAEFGAEG